MTANEQPDEIADAHVEQPGMKPEAEDDHVLFDSMKMNQAASTKMQNRISSHPLSENISTFRPSRNQDIDDGSEEVDKKQIDKEFRNYEIDLQNIEKQLQSNQERIEEKVPTSVKSTNLEPYVQKKLIEEKYLGDFYRR